MTLPLLFKCFFVFVLVACLFVLVPRYLRRYFVSKQERRIAKGKILSHGHGKSVQLSGLLYSPSVQTLRYEYTVDQKRYEGTRISASEGSSAERFALQQELNHERYRIGDSVFIYYSPDNPHDAYLEPGLNDKVLGSVYLVMCVLIGAVVLATLFVGTLTDTFFSLGIVPFVLIGPFALFMYIVLRARTPVSILWTYIKLQLLRSRSSFNIGMTSNIRLIEKLRTEGMLPEPREGISVTSSTRELERID